MASSAYRSILQTSSSVALHDNTEWNPIISHVQDHYH
uniref:Uncharacterized protein n=1 Tax=Anguilla anguilla TaxID=7936 RepID=A0A0E9T4P7_ANGAN